MSPAGLGYASAVTLALVLAAAAGTKARDGAATAASFAALGVPRPATTARVVPVVEAGTALVLLLTPALGGLVALTVLLFFTTFLVGRLRAGVRAPCSCFGARRRDSLSVANLVGNAFLLLLAVVALAAPAPTWPGVADLVVLGVAVAAEVALHTFVRHRVASRRGAAVGDRVPDRRGAPG